MSVTNGSEQLHSETVSRDWRPRLLQRLRDRWSMIILQGMTPHSLATGLAIGATIGILPTFWGTSLICFGLAWALRLNHLATQFANYLAYPLQICLFVPFLLLGKQILPGVFADVSGSRWHELYDNWGDALELLLPYQACAFVGWLVTAPFIWLLVYLLVRMLPPVFAGNRYPLALKG